MRALLSPRTTVPVFSVAGVLLTSATMLLIERWFSRLVSDISFTTSVQELEADLCPGLGLCH